MIDYIQKLTTDRAFYLIENLEYSIESDRRHILSSPAFRETNGHAQMAANADRQLKLDKFCISLPSFFGCNGKVKRN